MSRVEPNRNVYVGHRYVPKIFGEWDKKNEYEGLSIVTHQGNSYTSKKRTPVGVDIKNEEYWVITGNYNAQVEYYRDETERVSELLKSKVDNEELDNFKNIINKQITEFEQSTDTTIEEFEMKINKTIDDFILNISESMEKNKLSYGYTVDLTNSDDKAADIQNFYNSLPDNSTMLLPHGTHEINKGLKFKRKIHLDFTGATLQYTGSGDNEVVQLGDENGESPELIGVTYKGINVKRSLNWEEKTTGIRFVNVYASLLDECSVVGFYNGLVVEGINNTGNSYNKINLGWIFNNKRSIVLTSSERGWSNENIYSGGRLGWGSDSKDYVDEKNVHILIEYKDYSQNNNRFYGVSLESGVQTGEEYAIYMENGRMNTFRDCRYEGARNIYIAKGSLYTVLDGGFDLSTTNIDDKGSNTQIKHRFEHKSVLQGTHVFGNSYSGSDNIVSFLNPTNTEVGSLNGNGDFKVNRFIESRKGTFLDGVRFYGFAEQSQRGIYIGNGNPENVVTTNPGSIYLDINGSLYIKRNGSSNTGWKVINTSFYSNSLNRPSNPQPGYSMLDSTIRKPIWYDGEKWIDSNGEEV